MREKWQLELTLIYMSEMGLLLLDKGRKTTFEG
jgi:hypothetical protein